MIRRPCVPALAENPVDKKKRLVGVLGSSWGVLGASWGVLEGVALLGDVQRRVSVGIPLMRRQRVVFLLEIIVF